VQALPVLCLFFIQIRITKQRVSSVLYFEIDYYILLYKMIGEDIEEYLEEASECEDLEEEDTSEYTPSADSQHGKQRK